LVCQPDGSGRKEANLRSNVKWISQFCEEIDPVLFGDDPTLQMGLKNCNKRLNDVPEIRHTVLREK
jgi:hypothetical protein